MRLTNLTAPFPLRSSAKPILFIVHLLASSLAMNAQTTCNPAAEFSYNGSAFCQNGTNPVLSHTTGINGTYTFTVTSGGPTLSLNSLTGAINLAASNPGVYQVTNSVTTSGGGTGSMVITGIIDGGATGGLPKAIEFYVLNDIPNLNLFSFSSYFNGSTTPGNTFTFPNVSVSAGTRIWVATESPTFTSYFGFPPTYTSSAINVNGDDAVRLFYSGTIIDVFGVVGQDGTGTPWDYLDGWAYRKNNTGPDGSTFILANWNFSGVDATDGVTVNANAANPMPIGTYTYGGSTVTCSVTVQVVAPPQADAGPDRLICEGSPANLSAIGSGGTWSGGLGSFSSTTNPNAIYTPAASEIGTAVTLTWTVPSAGGGVCQGASDVVRLTFLEAADAEFSYDENDYCPNGINPVPSHSSGSDGLYSYTVISGGPLLAINPQTGVINLAGSNTGTYNVTNSVSGCGNLVISGVIDGPVTGGLPKAIEFYALANIPDLSAYGFGSANNGGGSDGQEFTFPAISVAQGSHIWVATEAPTFTSFFGFAPNFVDDFAPSINGDDAIELFCNGMVIDVFGQINVDGSGQPWEYTDGWAYRKNNTGPDGSFFSIANWTFSGIDALDGFNTNAAATKPLPAKSFTSNVGPICSNDFHSQIVTIDDTIAPVINCPADIVANLEPGQCEAILNFSVTATDDCDPSPDITQNDLTGLGNGDAFPIGSYPLQFTATDLLGNSSSCQFSVTVLEYPNPTTTLSCNDLVQASLDNNGQALIGADMVLEGGPYGCYDDYDVEILTGSGTSAGNPLDCGDIGKLFTVKVTDPETGNSCWGQITVEDKIAPVLTCQDITLSCTQSVDVAPKPTLTDNCDQFPTLNLVELILIDNDVCDDNKARYRRSWMAFDDYGNQSTPCQDIVTILRPTLVDFPNDITWDCGQYAQHANITAATALNAAIVDADPSDDDIDVSAAVGAAVLSATGSGVPANIIGEFCQYNFNFSDEVLEVCGGATGVFKIVRTWTVFDWCAGVVVKSGVGGEDNIQIIKVIDTTGPSIDFPNNVTVVANVAGVHPEVCVSTGLLPVPTATDACAGVSSVHIYTALGEAINGFIPSPGLPLGNHAITVSATDVCGNVTTKNATVTVIDNIAPVSICDDITDVNISSDGLAEVFATTFNDGSYDNCCLDKFEVRRMSDPCNDGHNDLVFGASVYFCCQDLGAGNSHQLVFRAYDCFGNHNDCMVTVSVQDKVSPVLVSCPANQRITCDYYADALETQLDGLSSPAQRSQFLDQFFGAPVFQDNCVQSPNRTFASSIDQCLEGSITRTWTATDNAGNNSQACTQTIFIDHVSDWVVSFPADLTVDCGTTAPDFGEPSIFSETCELVGISYQDEIYNVVADACYKVTRSWVVINWCVVGAEIDQEVTESSEREFQLAYPAEPCDFDGDGDCDTRTYRDSWRVSPKSKPGAASANQSSSPDTDADSDPWDGYVTYQQVIKVKDSVDPVFIAGCQIPQVCIETSNCAATVVLPTPDVSDCSANVTISATVTIGGASLSGFGPYNNVGPGSYPVTYIASDNCNNQKACTATLTVKDCKKPTPVCKNKLVVDIMSSNPPMIEVFASQFNEGSYDNCTPAGSLKYSLSSNTSDVSLVLDCSSLGNNIINLWVTDQSGNQDFCGTYIELQDNLDVCPNPLVALGGSITDEDSQSLNGVTVQLGGTTSGTAMTSTDGGFLFTSLVPGGDYSLVPSKDVAPLNGVTTFDLVLISKHILGSQPLGSPYKIIAADANNSKTVTTFDLVELRKLILFVIDEFPNNSSWRFVRKDFNFPNPANPWQTVFPELINLNDISADQLSADFIGIKIGDVNCSANPSGLTGQGDDRGQTSRFMLRTDDVRVNKGEVITVPFRADKAMMAGLQFTLRFDKEKLEFVEVVPAVLAEENFGFSLLDKGVLTSSWNKADGSAEQLEGMIFGLTFRAKADGSLSELLQMSSEYTVAEAYDAQLQEQGIELSFDNDGSIESFQLYQNTPNPFADKTTIGFQLPEAGSVTLTLSDLAGRVVKVIEADFSAGYQEFVINRIEIPTANGVLYYRVASAAHSDTRRMILVD
ncbi:MAG: hypothetical protein RI973_57 [Bacteroidota bacterium]|jgi:hypothetical protein